MAEPFDATRFYLVPWHVEYNPQRHSIRFIISPEGDLIGSALQPGPANLFAAAPDLLLALRALLPEVKAELEQRQTSGNAEDCEPLAAIVAAAEAALARAGGAA